MIKSLIEILDASRLILILSLFRFWIELIKYVGGTKEGDEVGE